MSWLFENFNNLIMYLDTSYGIFLFFFIYLFSVIFLIPGSLLSLLAGFLYGGLFGSFIVFISAFAGASLTFFISQYYFSNRINKFLSKFSGYPLLEEIIKKGGLKLFILTRLSPIFPFGILNYFYGINKISFRDFSLSLFFILPGTYLYCSLGSLANEIRDIQNITFKSNFTFTLLGFLSTCLLFYFLVKYTNDYFKGLDKF